jgi:DNA-binding CsgD family transcriptional regulator
MHGVDADRLENACKLLGDTVLDPAIWPLAMDEICRAAAATGAMLLQSDVRTADVPRTPSFDEPAEFYFRNGWHTRDSRAKHGVPLMLGGMSAVIDQDVMSAEQMRADAMYNECLLPNGFQWFAAVGFWANTALWALSIQRTPAEGPFEERDKRALAGVSRRLTEMATLSAAVGRSALSGATNTLNAVHQPAIAVDRLGFVLDANPAAEAMFDDCLHVKDRRLFVADARAKACLETLTDQLRVTPDTAALPCDPIVVRRKGQAPVIVRALPVHGAARNPFLGARALLTLAAVAPRPGPKPALLAKIFGLTPAEAKLASLMAEGLSPERAAEELKIARGTARNHLKAVFAKTATHRQGELVALLSRL